MDFRQQRGLQIAKTRIIKKMHNGFAVQSQGTKQFYFVDKNGKCNCPDSTERGIRCKHSYAIEYFLNVEKTHIDGTKTVEKVRLTYPQAWHAYTEAQKSEVELFDRLLKDFVDNFENPEYGFGRPALNRQELLFCSIKKVYSQLSSRRAHTLFRNSESDKLIEKAPNYNAINKFLNEKSLTPMLKQLVALSSMPLQCMESNFAIDSTGFRTTRFNDYCREKHGEPKQHHWLKAHACIGTKTNTICSVEITDENGADNNQFAPLIQTASENGFTIREVTADKAYSSRQNFELVNQLGGTAFIPFRSNATGNSKGSPLWKKMYHYFQYNKDDFLKHYHTRSNVESTFMALKTKFGDCLKSKNFVSQTNELLCKIIAYNIVVLIHEMHELGIEKSFFQRD